MANTRINTDVLLANLFSNDTYSYFTIDEIVKYHECLSYFYSGTLMTDLCEESVKNCCERYPDLFQLKHSTESSVPAVWAGPYKPNLLFFNAAYNDGMRGFLKRTTKYYLLERIVRDGNG